MMRERIRGENSCNLKILTSKFICLEEKKKRIIYYLADLQSVHIFTNMNTNLKCIWKRDLKCLSTFEMADFIVKFFSNFCPCLDYVHRRNYFFPTEILFPSLWTHHSIFKESKPGPAFHFYQMLNKLQLIHMGFEIHKEPFHLSVIFFFLFYFIFHCFSQASIELYQVWALF